MAGLLAGRHVVTHHMGTDVLGSAGAIPIHARVVDDGNLITSGGVTSGLDLGLYLLERELGPRIAHAVEELFEYERRGTIWHNRGLSAVAIESSLPSSPPVDVTIDGNTCDSHQSLASDDRLCFFWKFLSLVPHVWSFPFSNGDKSSLTHN
jgi:hypothetical protein